jgi:hypothetical protein
VLQLSPGQTALWEGQTVDDSSVLIKYTYAGDANLDGRINIEDYIRIDSNVPLDSSGYANGDFNYDGSINIFDYVTIDFNIDVQGTPIHQGQGLTQAVPEPTVMIPLAATALLLARRARRRGA